MTGQDGHLNTAEIEKKAEMKAVQGTGIVCFLAAIIGGIYLMRPVFLNDPIHIVSLPVLLECISWVVLLIGVIWLWTHKKGWGGIKGKIVVFSLFGGYLLYSVLLYPEFQQIYLQTVTGSEAAAGAMVGVKLFVVLIGITAGIPVGPKIDGREYAQRLREKAMRQEAEWAVESVKGAKKELQTTVERIKDSLTEEELRILMKELQDTFKEESPENSGSDVSTADIRNGWGGGV